MKKGISLHIGLNVIDPAAYGTDGKLENCVNDAKAMAAIATANGFSATSLHDDQATSTQVTCEITRAASQLAAGDYFLLTYAGHGSQVPDEDNLETDGMNETWCLYDRQFIDNELYCLWGKFAAGVKIFVLSDSCHSGTMMRHFLKEVKPELRALPSLSRRPERILPSAKRVAPLSPSEALERVRQKAVAAKVLTPPPAPRAVDEQRKRVLPAGFSMINYLQKRDLYRNLILLAGEKRSADIAAGLIYISGCQDNQTSGDGPAGTNGVFTGNTLKVWNKGVFTGDYPVFYDKILDEMPSDQTPNYMKLGTVTSSHEGEKPFIMVAGAGTVTPTPSAGGLTSPSIGLPDQWNVQDGPPTLQINKGGNTYYYVELATDKKLFNNAEYGGQRKAENFYATYRDSNVGLRTDSTFTVPGDAWNNLKGAGIIYYRIGTTSGLSGWPDFRISFGDSQWQTAPSMELVSGVPTPATPGGYTEVTLTAPVGPAQPNKKEDVKKVQTLLNQVPNEEGGPAVPLKADGLYGVLTGNAIKKFQDFYGLDSDPSEYRFVKPGSNTLQQLNDYAASSRAVKTAPPVMERSMELLG